MRMRSITVLGRSISSAVLLPLAAARAVEINHHHRSVVAAQDIGVYRRRQRHEGFLSPTTLTHFHYSSSSSSSADQISKSADGPFLLRAFKSQEKCMEAMFHFFYVGDTETDLLDYYVRDIQFSGHSSMDIPDKIEDKIEEWGLRYFHLVALLSPSIYKMPGIFGDEDTINDRIFWSHFKCAQMMLLFHSVTCEEAYDDLHHQLSRSRSESSKEISTDPRTYFNKYFPFKLQQDKDERNGSKKKRLLTRKHGDDLISVEASVKGEASDCVMALAINVSAEEKNSSSVRKYDYSVEATEEETKVLIESASFGNSGHVSRDFSKESKRNYDLYLQDIGITPTLIHILWAEIFEEYFFSDDMASRVIG